MLQFLGTIAVVVSVLVLAYQAREVAHQTRMANQVAATNAHRDLIYNWREWAKPFIDHPELHSMYFGEAATEPSDADRVRLVIIAETHADWLEAGLTTQKFAYYAGAFNWNDYATWVLASTPSLREMMRDQPNTWPQLNAYLARYDSHEQDGV